MRRERKKRGKKKRKGDVEGKKRGEESRRSQETSCGKAKSGSLVLASNKTIRFSRGQIAYQNPRPVLPMQK